MVLLYEKVVSYYSVTKDELMNSPELKNCSFQYGGNRFTSYFLKDGEPFVEGHNMATRQKWDFFKEDEEYIANISTKRTY